MHNGGTLKIAFVSFQYLSQGSQMAFFFFIQKGRTGLGIKGEMSKCSKGWTQGHWLSQTWDMRESEATSTSSLTALQGLGVGGRGVICLEYFIPLSRDKIASITIALM